VPGVEAFQGGDFGECAVGVVGKNDCALDDAQGRPGVAAADSRFLASLGMTGFCNC
jgi:hypothetical protein